MLGSTPLSLDMLTLNSLAETQGYATHAVSVADLDNDGDKDVVLGNKGVPDTVYLQCGSGFRSMHSAYVLLHIKC